MHLTPDEFVDVAEGTRPAASLPHLAVCDTCRGELAALRAAMSEVGEADVPEPSPLFWSSLSARVNEAIDAHPASDGRWWTAWMTPRVFVPLSAVALLALVVALAPNWRAQRPGPATGSTSTSTPAVNVELASDVDLPSDPLLTLVSDLNASLNVDDASAVGFTGRDTAEHAVTHMNTDELRTLKQLLQVELSRKGA